MSRVNGVDRRRFLQWGAAAATATAGATALSGCGPETNDGPGTSAAAGRLLRVGASDATGSTTLDPRHTGFGASYIALYHLYDQLMYLKDGGYELGLAQSVQPNADATEWTVRIHDRAVFHDGSPVRAADVAYSLRTLAGPSSTRATNFADLDPDRLKVVDAHTLEVGLRRPRGDFRESVLAVFSPVFPEGTGDKDFARGIGSGPYRLEGNDGKNLRLTRNTSYWGGAAGFERIELVLIADPAARLNALKSGQIDYAFGISATGATAERGNHAIRVRRGGTANSNALSFAMNQNLAPFDNPDVRRAVRLAADRDALVNRVLLGLGSRGDDVVGKGLPGYAVAAAGRRRDTAEARRLFARAGVDSLTLHAADTVPGFVAAARLLGQQLKEAGVELKVEQVPADTYYADLKSLGRIPFQTFYYTNRPAAVHLSATTVKGAFFNVTGLGEPHWKRLAQAQAVVDDGARQAAFAAVQRDLFDNGGDLLWGFREQLDASVTGLTGVWSSQSIPVFTRARVA
ncbi:ABC transporter substrate-binding protein [Streptomyces sp. NPDC028635]|uniref:ABC transporter substrate-binding protein n=1 Tax=Streptomyces sp. NPDC028635 TaxID=3154800 RepID=UPI0033E419B5